MEKKKSNSIWQHPTIGQNQHIGASRILNFANVYCIPELSEIQYPGS